MYVNERQRPEPTLQRVAWSVVACVQQTLALDPTPEHTNKKWLLFTLTSK